MVAASAYSLHAARQRHWPRRVLILLALLCWLLPPLATAQQAPPDLTTYQGWLREAVVAAQRSDRLTLEQVADNLTDINEVRLPDDTRLPVDNSWLAQALNTDSPDFALIEARLGALLDALAQPDAAVSAADARQRLDDLLNQPPLAQNADESAADDTLARVLEWFFGLIEWMFDSSSGGGAIFRPLVLVVFGVLLAGVLLYLALQARRALVREAQAAPDSAAETRLTATSALQQASTLARGGDYRTAVRYLYLSSLLWLDEQNLLRYDRALTNREYLNSLTERPDLRAHLSPIVETFDQVWYGHAMLDAESFQAYQQQVEALRQLRL